MCVCVCVCVDSHLRDHGRSDLDPLGKGGLILALAWVISHFGWVDGFEPLGDDALVALPLRVERREVALEQRVLARHRRVDDEQPAVVVRLEGAPRGRRRLELTTPGAHLGLVEWALRVGDVVNVLVVVVELVVLVRRGARVRPLLALGFLRIRLVLFGRGERDRLARLLELYKGLGWGGGGGVGG